MHVYIGAFKGLARGRVGVRATVKEDIVMAQRVAGELYWDLDGQLLEIKRQLRQLSGYPFDAMRLKTHLQDAAEGRFIMSKPSLSSLIKAKNFEVVNPDITDNRFPAPNRLWNDYEEFPREANLSWVVRRMQADGYEPANSHEFLLWEGWAGKHVVALDSIAMVNGCPSVLELFNYNVLRSLSLISWNDILDTDCWFLGVRPSAPRDR